MLSKKVWGSWLWLSIYNFPLKLTCNKLVTWINKNYLDDSS